MIYKRIDFMSFCALFQKMRFEKFETNNKTNTRLEKNDRFVYEDV